MAWRFEKRGGVVVVVFEAAMYDDLIHLVKFHPGTKLIARHTDGDCILSLASKAGCSISRRKSSQEVGI